MTVRISDDVVEESGVGFRLVRGSPDSPVVSNSIQLFGSQSREVDGIGNTTVSVCMDPGAYLVDLNASRPIAEYLSDESLASLTRSSAT